MLVNNYLKTQILTEPFVELSYDFLSIYKKKGQLQYLLEQLKKMKGFKILHSDLGIFVLKHSDNIR